MSRNWKRMCLVVAFVLPIVAIAVHKLPGKLAVAKLCEKDGGLEIYSTAFADGYYDFRQEGYCERCIDKVARGEFAWIGVRTDPKLYGVPGEKAIFRIEVRDSGSPDCSSNATLVAQRKRVGIPALAEGKCIGLVADSEEPNGFAIERRLSRLPSKLHNPIEKYEVTVLDLRTGQKLAEFRGYAYIASTTKAFDAGSKVGSPDASCPDPASGTFRESDLLDRVLRDWSLHQ